MAEPQKMLGQFATGRMIVDGNGSGEPSCWKIIQQHSRRKVRLQHLAFQGVAERQDETRRPVVEKRSYRIHFARRIITRLGDYHPWPATSIRLSMLDSDDEKTGLVRLGMSTPTTGRR